MTWNDLTVNPACSGIARLMVCVNDESGGLYVALLLFVYFLAVLIGSYSLQKAISGDGNFAKNLMASGVLTFILSLLLSLIDGLMNIYVLTVVFVVMIITIIVGMTSDE